VLYHLLLPLESVVRACRLIESISFRAAFAAVLAFLVAVYVGPGIVATLAAKKIAGTALTGSTQVDAERLAKAKIPTMGGVILLVGVGLSSLLFVRLDTPYTWATILSFLAFGGLGAVDDWRKLTRPGSQGLSERAKLGGQVLIALAVILGPLRARRRRVRPPTLPRPGAEASPYPHLGEGAPRRGRRDARLHGRAVPRRRGPREGRRRGQRARGPDGTLLAPVVGSVVKLPARWTDDDRHRADLQLPFFKRFCLDLGLLLLPFAILVIVGASNAVNFTDGQDGLAIGCTATVAVTLTVTAYLASRVDLSRDLFLFHVPEAGSSRSSARPSSADPWASSGSTATRPPSSWATRGPSRSAGSSACSRWPCGTSSRSSSPAASSSPRRARSCCSGRGSS
jgi:UDP-N-acetylmuramyl pentapeptide phosphotransferase/UDP-N-acetylglucosamine-1-phosphate transferase